MGRKPLECIAMTGLVAVVSLSLSRHLPRIFAEYFFALVAQGIHLSATLIAMDADARAVALNRRQLRHCIFTSCKWHLVGCLSVQVLVFALTSITSGLAYASAKMTEPDASIFGGLYIGVYQFYLWYIASQFFNWPLMLDTGFSPKLAFIFNHVAKRLNLKYHAVITVVAVFGSMSPPLALALMVYTVFLNYVAYREIFLGIDENAKVTVANPALQPT